MDYEFKGNLGALLCAITIGKESYGVLERGIPANSLCGETAGESEEDKQNPICNVRVLQ